MLQLGFAYDSNPVDSEDRTLHMLIDRLIRYATGAQYQWSEKLSLGGKFACADYVDAKIKNTLCKGEYKRNGLFFMTLNVSWKF